MSVWDFVYIAAIPLFAWMTFLIIRGNFQRKFNDDGERIDLVEKDKEKLKQPSFWVSGIKLQTAQQRLNAYLLGILDKCKTVIYNRVAGFVWCITATISLAGAGYTNNKKFSLYF